MNPDMWVRRMLLLLVLGSLGSGCDTQERQDAFADEASRPASGYTETDDTGNVVTRDDDDWRTSPVYLGIVRVDPAYPNPAQGVVITIPVTVFPADRTPGRLSLRYRDPSGRLQTLVQPLEAGVGLTSLSFESGLFPERGLYRVFIFDGVGELVSYGDIQVE